MSNLSKSKRMRIYLSSTDKFKSAPLYETVVFLAKRNKISGATVLKGIMGFGASSAVTSSRFWTVAEKLPIVIEIIDEEEKLNLFFGIIKPYLEKVKKGITVTIEDIEILMHQSGSK